LGFTKLNLVGGAGSDHKGKENKVSGQCIGIIVTHRRTNSVSRLSQNRF